MKTSLCINQNTSIGCKPQPIADYVDGKLIEPWSRKAVKTVNSLTIELDEVGFWTWDEDGTFENNKPTDIGFCELLELGTNISFSEEKRLSSFKKVRQLIGAGISTDYEIKSAGGKLLLVTEKKNDKITGVLVQTDSCNIDGDTIDVDKEKNNYLDIVTLDVSDVFMHRGAGNKYRRFCLSDSVAYLPYKFPMKSELEIANECVETYSKHIRVKRRTKINAAELGLMLRDQKLTIDEYERNIGLAGSLDRHALTESLHAFYSGLTEDDAFIDDYLKHDEGFFKKCRDSIIDEVLKTKNSEKDAIEKRVKRLESQAEELDRKITEKQTKLDKLNVSIDEQNKKIINLDSDYAEKSAILDREYTANLERNKELEQTLGIKQDQLDELQAQTDNAMAVLEDNLINRTILKHVAESIKTKDVDFTPFLDHFKTLESADRELSKSVKEMTAAINEGLSDITDKMDAKTTPATVIQPASPEKIQKALNYIKGQKLPDVHEVKNLEDLINAMSDNLQNISGDVDELSKYLIASVFIKGRLVVTGDMCDLVGKMIAVTIFGEIPDVCYLADGGVSDLIDCMNSSENSVIIVNGVLPAIDYTDFFLLCRMVSRKILVFNCDDKQLLDSAPAEVWDFASFADVSDYDRLRDFDVVCKRFSGPDIQPGTGAGILAEWSESLTKSQYRTIDKFCTMMNQSKPAKSKHICEYLKQILKSNGEVADLE